MKETAVYFSDTMVCATLAGRQTQARFPIKPQPTDVRSPPYAEEIAQFGREVTAMGQIDDSGWQPLRCPFGGAGDFLYVREAFKHVVSGALSETGAGATFGQLRYGIAYRADGATVWDQHTTRVTQIAGTPTGPLHFSTKPNPWRRAINMARRFSRIKLEITAVRVERLRDISDLDVLAGGIMATRGAGPASASTDSGSAYREAYLRHWDSVGRTRIYSAAANPAVWVIDFRRRP